MSLLTVQQAEKMMNNHLSSAFAYERRRIEYMKRAHYIGTNAINLVRDYFDYRVTDFVNGKPVDWTINDLDRALTEMKRAK